MQAKDLEPWYATIDPDPDTLAKARADFGGIILTPEIVTANRHPETNRTRPRMGVRPLLWPGVLVAGRAGQK